MADQQSRGGEKQGQNNPQNPQQHQTQGQARTPRQGSTRRPQTKRRPIPVRAFQEQRLAISGERHMYRARGLSESWG